MNLNFLEIAKFRLRELFDVIMILELPETHVQINKYFQFLGDELVDELVSEGNDGIINDNNGPTMLKEMAENESVLPHKNARRYMNGGRPGWSHERRRRNQFQEATDNNYNRTTPSANANDHVILTREEFYHYNSLDKELYDYAIDLALEKTKKETKKK